MPTRYALDSLLLFDPDRSASVGNVWISRPTPSEEQALGKVFVVSAITTPSRLNHEIITILQDEIRTQYYQSTEPLLEAAFEQALAKLNQRLHMLIIEGINEWVDHANFVIGVCRQQHVVLTIVGNMEGYLLRDRRLQPIFMDYSPAAINPLRVFSTTWHSTLKDGDRLLFSTPTLLDYFSLEKLRRTILDHSPIDAVRALESNLLGVDMNQAVAALLLEATMEEEPSAAPLTPVTPVAHYAHSRTAPQVSMEELNERERQTEQLLSPSVWPAIRDVVHQLTSASTQFLRTVVFRRPPRRTRPAAATLSTPSASSTTSWTIILSATGHLIARIGQGIWNGIAVLWKRRRTIVQSPAPLHLPARQKPSARMVVEGGIHRFQQLTRTQQALIGAGLVLVLILTTAIVRGGSNSTPSTTTKKLTPEAASQTIGTEVAKAEAALLYGGNDTAAASLKTAEQALASLPQHSKQEKTQYATLAKTVNDLRQKVAHLTIITTPTMWLDLGAKNLATAPTEILLADGSLIALDGQNNRITVASRQNPASAQSIANTLDTGALVQAAPDGTQTVLFATDRAGFVRYDLTAKTWKPLDAQFPYTTPAITDMAIFQHRVYALDAAKNAITRFSIGTTSLGAGASWLKESATLSQVVGLSIDGTIYTISKSGTMVAYLQGKKSTLAFESADPPITNAATIRTDANATNVYIVDPAQHRFLVYTKQGRLLDQYQSPAWTKLKDIAIDEKTKTAYVLNGTTIATVTLLH